MISSLAAAETPPAASQKTEPNFLLLEVHLDQHVLSDSLTAYQSGTDILLPLGELSKILTIGITTQPEQGVASGFVLHEEQTFSMNVAQASVTRSGQNEFFDPSLVMVQPDDIYVAISLITEWLPLDFDLDLSILALTVRPREMLPLQLRLERERLAAEAGSRGVYQDPGYPRLNSHYQLLSVPFLDQTLAFDRHHGNGSTQDDLQYTAYLTGDLLGMESALYFSDSTQDTSPDVRFTLGRRDPDAGLLGPLHARSMEFGNVQVPGVSNISFTSPKGNGAAVSNRPLTQPTAFDFQTLQGNLPPGWDVELYYNDALIGFQRSRPDGLYTFENEPLLYGENDFRLVFHGPLGQLRVERQIYYLEDSIPQPGEFYYSFADHLDSEEQTHLEAQFDWGLVNHLAANGGVVETPVAGDQQRYANVGLRAYWQAFILTGDLIEMQDGGSLVEAGLKTRIDGFSFDLSHAQLNDFTSETFLPSGDPVRMRDTIKIGGMIPLVYLVLPVTLEGTRDHLESGDDNLYATGRVSAYLYSTALTNELRWQSFSGVKSSEGTFQISRRLAGFGFNGQINYEFQPENQLTTAALTGTRDLAEGYLLDLGVAHTFPTPQTLYTAGISKNLGHYGLAINSSYSTTGEVAVGMQLFVATGMEPRRSEWLFDAQPMANSGAVSARVFFDRNLNGVMDSGEEAIAGVGFTVNGGNLPFRTDADGIAYLSHLPVDDYEDIAIDPTTLEDPQWLARPKGVRLVPRPGNVSVVDFPVVMTSEIDGIVYLLENDVKRGIGDAQLELIDDSGKVVARATSSSDGYYILQAVLPGNYSLRISPEQLARLNLTDPGARPVTVSPDGDFVNGVDFIVTPEQESSPPQGPPSSVVPEAPPAVPGEQKETDRVPDPTNPDPQPAIKPPIQGQETFPAPNPSASDNLAAADLFNQGMSLFGQSDYGGAVRALEKSIGLDAESAWTYYYLGYAYYQMEQFSKARAAFSRAYELDPRFTPRLPASSSDAGNSP
jgi:hypothetical protein